MTVRNDRPASRRTRALLAGAALMLAAGAPFAGRLPTADSGVTPLELAQRIRDREAGLRVLDVRADAAATSLVVPTATVVDPDAPATWPLDSAGALVVYALDDAASRAARAAAAAAGRPDAQHLRGGLAGWVDEVLEPVLPAPVTARDSADHARVAELSRYFGGLPRTALPGDDSSDAAERVRRAVRRGCGPGF